MMMITGRSSGFSTLFLYLSFTFFSEQLSHMPSISSLPSFLLLSSGWESKAALTRTRRKGDWPRQYPLYRRGDTQNLILASLTHETKSLKMHIQPRTDSQDCLVGASQQGAGLFPWGSFRMGILSYSLGLLGLKLQDRAQDSAFLLFFIIFLMWLTPSHFNNPRGHDKKPTRWWQHVESNASRPTDLPVVVHQLDSIRKAWAA